MFSAALIVGTGQRLRILGLRFSGYAKILEKSGYHIGVTHKDHVRGKKFGPQFNKAGRKVNGFSQYVSKGGEIAKRKEGSL